MPSHLDLSDIPIVDNHAHPLVRSQPRSPSELRRHFFEAHSPVVADRHGPSAVQYRWAVRQLASFLHIDPSETALIQYRESLPLAEYAGKLAAGAGLAWLLLDEGYPPPHVSHTWSEMERMLGVRVGRVLRLETLVQELMAAHGSFAELVAAFDSEVGSARRSGYVGLKSIAAYRTGLAIATVQEEDAERAFREAQREMETRRLTSKPLIDFFVRRGLRHAASQALPVQFHTGYGDPDLDLRLANPLHLRLLFEDPALSEVPIVLLHESYPFTAEAAFLAAVYPNVYVDLAFSLPPLDLLELRRVAGIALGTAPASKVMVSSDGVEIPEHYWLGAVRARQVLSFVLGAMVEAGELEATEAAELGRLVLHDNAVALYRLQAL